MENDKFLFSVEKALNGYIVRAFFSENEEKSIIAADAEETKDAINELLDNVLIVKKKKSIIKPEAESENL